MADKKVEPKGSDSGASKASDSVVPRASDSVVEYAKQEMAEVAERERKKKLFHEGQKRAADELPKMFFKLAEDVRREVDAFNQIVDAGRRISLQESAGLAAHAEPGRGEINLRIHRKNVEAWVGLSELMRLGQSQVTYIIEGQLRFSKTSLRLRIDAIPNGDGLRYRINSDSVEQKFGIEELGSRIVLAVAKDDPAPLGGFLPPS